MFPYSLRQGHIVRRNEQKSFRIPNHPKQNYQIIKLLKFNQLSSHINCLLCYQTKGIREWQK